MLVFYEGWNIRELWKKGEVKRLNSTIYGQNWQPGTGTKQGWYRYH